MLRIPYANRGMIRESTILAEDKTKSNLKNTDGFSGKSSQQNEYLSQIIESCSDALIAQPGTVIKQHMVSVLKLGCVYSQYSSNIIHLFRLFVHLEFHLKFSQPNAL